ncbi:MAG: hypothetical protein AAGD11_08105 [Planctomycetota bacterium]
MKRKGNLWILFAIVLSVAAGDQSHAGTFSFGSGSGNSISGDTTGTISAGGFQMSVAALPAGGSVFDESDSDGLGVNSSAATGTADGDPDKFSIVGGNGAADGMGESITFSFDRSGFLTELRFDGLKDEALEFFQLQTPSGTVFSYFDAQTALRVPLNLLTVPNLRLLDPDDLIADTDDDITNLSLPFEPGEQFTITYGEFPQPSGISGLSVPNGARLQGIVVSAVPEPSVRWLSMACIALGFCVRCRI